MMPGDETAAAVHSGDDADSLFGDNGSLFGEADGSLSLSLDDLGDLGSLEDYNFIFGAGDGGSTGELSPFMDDTSESPPPASTDVGKTPLSMTALTLPTQPTASPALPTPTLPPTTLPSLSSPPRQPLTPSTSPRPLLTLPTPPCEDEQALGHQDVSTHNCIQPAEGDNSELELERALETELGLLQQEHAQDQDQDEQSVDSPNTEQAPPPSRDPHACRGEELRALNPRALGGAIKHGHSIPRRIDGPNVDLNVLIPYLWLDHSRGRGEVCAPLGLGIEEAEELALDAEVLLSAPECAAAFQNAMAFTSQDFKRISLMHIALHFLKEKGLGWKWFNRNDESGGNSRNRLLFWPDDSSLILCHFTALLYLSRTNRKPMSDTPRKRNQNETVAGAALKEKKRKRQRKTDRELPVLLAKEAPRNHGLDGRMPPEIACYSSPQCLAAAAASGAKLPAAMSTAEIPMPRMVNILAVETHTKPEAPLPSQEAIQRRRREKRLLKQGKGGTEPFLKVPGDANLQYVIHVVRGDGGGERLIPPIRLAHSDGLQTGGFWTVMGRCLLMRVSGTVEVFTTNGFEIVATDEEWDRAVWNVYSEDIMDGVVKVRVQARM